MPSHSRIRMILPRAVICCGAIGIAYIAGSHMRSLMAQTTGASFTATVREFSEKGGTRKLLSEYTEAHRADGSLRRVKRAFTGTKQDQLSSVLIERSDGYTIQLIPELKIKSTTYRDLPTRDSANFRRLNPATGCVSTIGSKSLASSPKLMQQSMLLGQRVDVVTDQAKTTFRYAPDLDCFALQQRNEFYSADGTKLEEVVEKETTSLTIGEPAVDFSSPADFEEVTPSQLHTRVATFLGMSGCPTCMKQGLEVADQAYSRMRPPQQ